MRKCAMAQGDRQGPAAASVEIRGGPRECGNSRCPLQVGWRDQGESPEARSYCPARRVLGFG